MNEFKNLVLENCKRDIELGGLVDTKYITIPINEIIDYLLLKKLDVMYLDMHIVEKDYFKEVVIDQFKIVSFEIIEKTKSIYLFNAENKLQYYITYPDEIFLTETLKIERLLNVKPDDSKSILLNDYYNIIRFADVMKIEDLEYDTMEIMKYCKLLGLKVFLSNTLICNESYFKKWYIDYYKITHYKTFKNEIKFYNKDNEICFASAKQLLENLDSLGIRRECVEHDVYRMD